jgi:maleate isomerase
MFERDYGRLGRIGVVTPQSNPTVEPELSLLLPPGVSMLTARCTSRAQPRQRLLDYFQRLGQTIAAFDDLPLEALGFACTASSYLLEPALEARATKALEERFGYPVITAATAIESALQFLNARRILLACPYPAWLLTEARHWWNQRGFEIADTLTAEADLQDTRGIYTLRIADVARKWLPAVADAQADAIVITGTGLPSLRLICDLQDATGIPAISSNLCLAWACLRAGGIGPGERSPEAGFPLLGGWRADIEAL